MKWGFGKAQINGDVLLPDDADGEETWVKSEEGGGCVNWCCCRVAVPI